MPDVVTAGVTSVTGFTSGSVDHCEPCFLASSRVVESPGPMASTVTTVTVHSTTAVRNVGVRIVQSTMTVAFSRYGVFVGRCVWNRARHRKVRVTSVRDSRESLIAAAAQALATGDALGALKRVALRNDAPALALRGVAMAQLGDLVRAKVLLRKAARAFGPKEPVARARCIVAEAEIALVSRDLSGPAKAWIRRRRRLSGTATGRTPRTRSISRFGVFC